MQDAVFKKTYSATQKDVKSDRFFSGKGGGLKKRDTDKKP